MDGTIFKSSEEWQVSGALAHTPGPARVEEVLKQRIERLLEEERRLLQVGSVQGDSFLTTALAQQLAKDEYQEYLERAYRVVQEKASSLPEEQHLKGLSRTSTP